MEPIISLRNVAKTHGTGRNSVRVLDDFSLDVHCAEFVALMGPSGAGKTTLLNLIGGLDRPDAGEVVVAGTHLERLTSRQSAKWRAQQVGFVFQSHNLLGILPAFTNVELPLFLRPMSGMERRRRVEEALAQVGLAGRMTHRPGELSGGQQQRVGIARAIVAGAPLLLCDEPTADLDRVTADEILGLLRKLSAQEGRTILMVTHDPEAARQATRLVHLRPAFAMEEGAG